MVRRYGLVLIVVGVVAGIAIAAIPEVENFVPVRSFARWLVQAHRYKTEVLAQPASPNGELKHIEWDGWGWGGQDTTIFLVFDPADSLSPAAKSHSPGKFTGIPCEVYRVRRLESHWYTAQFYTNEYWGRRSLLNCTGSGD